MRAFLSYDIEDPSFISSVRRLQRELDLTGAELKLVDPEIMHFTVRFLGEIDEEDERKIISVLKDNVENFELELNFRGTGVFPDERRMSVIWVGIDPASGEKLEKQSLAINKLLESVHTLRKQDSDRFSPHVTIARVRSGKNKDKLVEFIHRHKVEEFGKMEIGNLRLKLSNLTPSGPEYSDLHVFEK